ncbi:hypothetical protein, partial [Bradyrhizobium sp. F1.13.3]|uniref:hypothetical protein n=1 Tax=Bradyrhizobium sp. F1.13.3 TaxID=3156351 RepID=UPI0033955D56
GPSWIDLAEIRVNTTESRFVTCLNRLLQQNRPKAAIALWTGYAPYVANSSHAKSLRHGAAQLFPLHDFSRANFPKRL